MTIVACLGGRLGFRAACFAGRASVSWIRESEEGTGSAAAPVQKGLLDIDHWATAPGRIVCGGCSALRARSE